MLNEEVLTGMNDELGERIATRREALSGASRLTKGAALASLPLALGLMAKRAFGQAALPSQIVDALNFALTLEYLEADFYNRAMTRANLIPAGDRAVFAQIRDDENAHVALLRSVLGSQAVAMPGFDFTAGGMFPDVFDNYGTFLVLAQGFEDTGVRAYKGQAGELMSNDAILTTALRIHSVEARHASVVRRIRGLPGWIVGENTIPALAAVYAGEGNTVQGGVDVTTVTSVPAQDVAAAFDEPLTKAAVLSIATPFFAAGVNIDFANIFGVLNYAYALEQLEAAYYIRVVAEPYAGMTGEERAILTDLRDHEIAHREFFRTAIPALGGTLIPMLTPDFRAVDFNSRQSVLETARTFEDLGVAAYNGAARFVGDNATVLSLAGEIVSVEARHASVIADLLEPKTDAFAPRAFDPAMSPAAVVEAAQPFITNRITATNLPV